MSSTIHSTRNQYLDDSLIQELRRLLAEEHGQALADVADEEITRYLELLDAAPEPAESLCIHTLFEQQVERAPGEVAIICPSTSSGYSTGQQLTYGALNQRANQLAHHLRKLGVGPDGLVGICMERSLDLVVGLLGILKAGGAYVPLDPDEPPACLATILAGARPPVLLTQARLLEPLSAAIAIAWPDSTSRPPALVCLDTEAAIAGECAENPAVSVTPDHLAYMIHSSGQGILVEHRTVQSRLQWLQDEFALSSLDAVLHSASPALDILVGEICWPLAYGGRVVVAAPGQADPPAVRQLIAAHEISIAHFAPSALAALLASGGAEQAPALRWVLCSGEPLRQRVVDAFFQRYQCGLCYLYGPPEVATEVTAYTCQPGAERESVPAGYVTSNASVYVLDSSMQPVPIGVPGEIFIKGERPARAYLNAPDTLERRYVANPFAGGDGELLFKTGDVGCLLSDGMLELLGSTDRQVWIGGFRVALSELEAALRGDPAVDDCIVLPRETTLVAYVVPASPWLPERLFTRLRATLPAAWLPGAYVPLAGMPLTAAGQVDEAALVRLPVIDSELALRWEEQLRSLPEIEQVAVVIQEQAEHSAPLHLSDLLPGRVAPPASPVAQPAVAGPAEAVEQSQPRPPAISAGANLQEEAHAPQTLVEALQRAAGQPPGHGIIYLQPDGSEQRQSFAALLEEAGRVLAGLRKRGLKPGDQVILQLDLHQDIISAFWGCILGGFIPVVVAVPPSLDEPSGALDKLVNAWRLLDQPLILAGQALREPLQSLPQWQPLGGVQVAALEELRANDPDLGYARSRPDDVAFFNLTSGSTGMPKCIGLTYRNILARARGTIQLCRHTPGDMALNWLPFDHIGSISDWHLRCVYLGCSALYVPTQAILERPLNWLDLIDRYRVSHSWAPNFAYSLINDALKHHPDQTWDLACIKALLTAGETVSPLVVQQFLAGLAGYGLKKTAIQPAFGMAELGSGINYFQPTEANPFQLLTFDKSSLGGTLRPVEPDHPNSVAFTDLGPVIPGMSMRIVDDRDAVLPEDTIGRLQVKGAAVFSGYYKNPEQNAAVFTHDGWFTTGDLAIISGGHLAITGREKEIIIINGANYYNHEIEAVVEEVEGVDVSYTAACAVQDPKSGTEKLAIFFVATTADTAPLIRKIRERVIARVGINPDYVLPLRRPDIPKTAIGKIQRAQLKQRFHAGEFNAILKQLDILLGNANTLPNWFYRKIWRRKEASTLAATPAAGPCLVFLDRAGLGLSLCAGLRRLGRQGVGVEAGLDFARLGADRYRIDPGNPDHYRRLLEALAGDGVSIDQIVHLWTYGDAGDVTSVAALEQAQDQGIYSLLFLVQALAATQPAEHPVQMYVVSSYTQAIGPADPIAYERAPLQGLLKTIPQETPWLRCRHIDIPPGPVEQNTACVLQELRVAQADREVGYRGGQRLVARLEKADFGQERRRELPFKPGGMYLLSGGLGGIGREVARYLAQEYGARLLLVGRTALPERSAWPAYLEQDGCDPVAERVRAYHALEQLGGEIAYATVDVCDLAGLRQAVEQAAERWQCTLDGVIHLAGSYHEQFLLEETRASLAATLRPKVSGTWVLNQLLKDQPAGLFISFSSLVSLFGGALVGAYAAANSFLEAFSQHQRRTLALPSYCFAWSIWDEVGVSRSTQMKDAARSRGLHAITIKQGLHSLLAGLHHDHGNLLIGLDGSNPHIRGSVESSARPLQKLCAYITIHAGPAPDAKMRDLEVWDRFQRRASCDVVAIRQMPLTTSGAIDRAALAALAQHARPASARHVAPRTEPERQIAAIWQELLGLQQVGIYDNFFELGGDSILAIQVIARASRAGLQLAPKQLFQYTTIADLAAAAGTSAAITIDQGLVTGPVPLTPVQQWFFSLDFPNPHRFNQAFMFTTQYPLDPTLLKQAVQHVLLHHDALRMRFVREESGWRQFNAGAEGEIPCSWIDLSALPDEEQSAAIEAHAERLQSSLHLTEGPILRVAVFDLGPVKPRRLAIIIHHLVVDGMSWRILVEDLQTAYMQLSRGEAVQFPPKTTSFKESAERLVEYAQTEEIQRELDYWLSRPADVPSLPIDHAGGTYTLDSTRLLFASLSVEETRALLQVLPKTYHTQINDALLTATLQAFASWTGQRSLLIDVVGHGREPIAEDIDLSRTIGWCGTTYPMQLELAEAASPVETLRSVSEQLRRVPNRGIGYDMLRYLSRDTRIIERLRALPEPKLVFSYLGQFDQTLSNTTLFELAREAVGRGQDPAARWPYLLDVYMHIVDGRLELMLPYSENLYRRSTIERFAENFLATLRALLASAGATGAAPLESAESFDVASGRLA